LELPERILYLLDEHRRKEIDLRDVEALTRCEPSIIKGINRFFANKLAKEGITTVRDLSQMTEKSLGAIEDDVLLKWTMAAKILCSYADLKDVEKVAGQKRVILTGIDSAGKTSTLRSLQEMKTVLDPQPTPGVAAEKFLFIGHNLSVFDLGGQKTFREMYLKNPDDYFSETMLLVFIIDVQSYSRFQEVFDYFEEVLGVLDLIGERPLITVHFHKFDTHPKATLQANMSHIKQHIDKTLKEKGWTNVFFFNTSILEIRTIISAFSTVFRAISPMTQVLNDTLRYYSELYDLHAAFIVSKRGMVISEYSTRMRSEDREQMFEDIYKEVVNSPEKIIRPDSREFGEKQPSKRYVIRSYPTGTYIAITPLNVGSEGDLFLAMLNQDLEKTPETFGDDFSQSIDLWVRHLFLPSDATAITS